MPTKNKIEDLRNLLFEQIEKLMDNDCNIDIEVMKSKSITSLAAVIIESAKVEIDFIRIHGNEGTGTGFIPVERKELK
jgi:hypothetical protein